MHFISMIKHLMIQLSLSSDLDNQLPELRLEPSPPPPQGQDKKRKREMVFDNEIMLSNE